MLKAHHVLLFALVLVPGACGKKRAQPGGIPPGAPGELTTPELPADADEPEGNAPTPEDRGEDQDGDFDSDEAKPAGSKPASAPAKSTPKPTAPAGAPPKWADDAAKKLATHAKGKRRAWD